MLHQNSILIITKKPIKKTQPSTFQFSKLLQISKSHSEAVVIQNF